MKTNGSHGARKSPVIKSYRWLENGHILLWLLKDTCWAMGWRTGAIFMVFPTVGTAFYLLWCCRTQRADLYHNIAVCLWIIANSTWMIGEFLKRDLRPVAAVFFFIGLLVLAIYYMFFFASDRKLEES